MRSATSLPAGLHDMLLGVLDAALELGDADFGNIQLLDEQGLRIAVQRGFPDWWVAHWDDKVPQGHGTCAAALREAGRVIVEDVVQSPVFSDPVDRDAMERTGVRAVQSTPLLGRSGEILGMFSTHYRAPHRPDPRTLRTLDLLAEHAAYAIERTRSDEALDELAVRARAVFENAPVGIVEVDPDTLRVTNANPAFCQLLGYSPADIIGLHILHDLTHPQDRAAGRRGYREATSPTVDRFHTVTVKRYLHRNGSPVWVERDLSRVPDAHGGPGFFIAVVRDLTEQRRNEELQRAQLDEIFRLQRLQTANELASVLAHEITQPLAAIPMYAEVAQQLLETGTDAERKELGELLDRIKQLAMHSGEIIHRMRRFYARGTIDPEPVELNAIVETALELLAPSARRVNVRLLDELAESLPRVSGVGVHIEQILLNLLRNAIDAVAGAGAGSGAVTVRTQYVDGRVRTTISDTGPGIAKEQADSLFDALQSTKAEGLGVGLRISRSLVQAHKGRLWVEPQMPGGVFHFELPLA